MHFVLGYIDPSSGSMIIQMIVGGTMAAVYGGRRAISHGVKTTIDKMRGRKVNETDESKTDKQG